ncbi:MAG: hypothetical protein QM503_15125 [Bacteroidota bacterium]
MIYRILSKGFFITGITAIIFLNSCTYDNIEELYPEPISCDTSNVTYSNDILPVLTSSCITCHSGAAPAGNIRLQTYDEIVAAANNGSLLGAISHDPNWSPMPKNGTKLSDCYISKLEIWIDNGTPNN